VSQPACTVRARGHIGAADRMEEWIVSEIERARQLLVANPLVTRDVMLRVLKRFREIFPDVEVYP